MKKASFLVLFLAACGHGGGGTTSTTTSGGGGSLSTLPTGGAGGALVDECQTGAAVCDPHADCVDTAGYYRCVCQAGFTGDGKTCADVDECQTLLADCDPNAACTNTAGSYTCACPSGFTGDGKTCHATYTAIAAGQFHACAIRADKTMWCWGHNTSGQVGTGTSDPIFVRPAPAGNATDWRAVGAGASFTCALDGSGKISCWGTNGGAQLGDGTTTGRSAPTPLSGGISDFTALEVGTNHTCALRADGSLLCWGTNLRGQIGDGTNNNATAPTKVGTDTWVAVSAGSEFTCAVRADHTLWCWGLDTSRQLGDGKTTNSNVPVQEKTLAADWASVTAGNAYACGVKQDGTRLCWGTNALGQCGDGTQTSVTQPTAIGAGTAWAKLDAGDFASCGLRPDGTLFCWGDGSLGQTAQPGAEGLALAPAQVGAEHDWTAVASGLRFACGLRDGGLVHCWGNAARAALGLGYSADRSDPAFVGSDADWTRVAVQLDDGCAIRGAGDLWCWGRNVYGELGDGTAITRSAPAQVGAGKVWTRVALGRTHTCGIADGAVLCWGWDANGEQGNGTGQVNQSAPSPISAITGLPSTWTAIAAGLNHTCAVGKDGTLWCWGLNSSGQLGDGTTTARPDPKQVLPAGAADWVDVSTAGNFTCALRATGALWCWGANTSGQLGEGDTTSPVSTPVAVGASTWAVIAAGQSHACAVDKAGALWCWGLNSSSQLGLGNSQGPVLTPTRVGSDTDWARPIVGQGPSTCALKKSGDLYCWGSGSFGQLGLGGLASFNTPQKVPWPGGWTSAALGNEHTCAVGADGRLGCWGASYGPALGVGVPFVSTPTAILEP
jgi:alpha-tubulin suppressor-like RCC1 family protein